MKKLATERLLTSHFEESAVEHLARYAFCLELVQGKNVLDAACGEGYGTNLLHNTAQSVTGVDIDAGIIQKAQRKYAKHNLEFIQASVLQLPFKDHSFDVVVSFETLEHLEEHEIMLTEIKRVLKPNGLLIISTPETTEYSQKRNYKNHYHKKELTTEQFKNLLGKLFSYQKNFGQQTVSASVIYAENADSFQNINVYNGNFASVKKENIFEQPMYLLALATDGLLPADTTLVFSSNSMLEHLKQAYESTWSYKIGRLVTSPFRFFKSLAKP